MPAQILHKFMHTLQRNQPGRPVCTTEFESPVSSSRCHADMALRRTEYCGQITLTALLRVVKPEHNCDAACSPSGRVPKPMPSWCQGPAHSAEPLVNDHSAHFAHYGQSFSSLAAHLVFAGDSCSFALDLFGPVNCRNCPEAFETVVAPSNVDQTK